MGQKWSFIAKLLLEKGFNNIYGSGYVDMVVDTFHIIFT